MSDISREDIVEYISNNFNINLTVQGLLKPTSQLLFELCNVFLAEFGMEQTDQPSFDCLSIAKSCDVELGTQSQFIANIFGRVSKIAAKVGLEVSVIDFVRPTPNQTRNILTVLCQSHSNIINIMSEMDRELEKRADTYRDREMLKLERNNFKNELENLKIARNTLKNSEIDAQVEEHKALITKLDDAQALNIKRSERIQILKKQFQQLRDKEAETEILKAKKKENIHVHTENFIEDPMKAINEANECQAERDRIEAELKQEQNLLNGIKKALKEQVKLQDFHKKVVKDIKTMICTQQDSDDPAMDSQQVEKEIADIESQIESIISQINTQKKELDKTKSKNVRTLKEMAEQKANLQTLFDGLEEDLPRRRSNMEAAIKEHKLEDDGVKGINDALEELPKRIQELRQRFQLSSLE